MDDTAWSDDAEDDIDDDWDWDTELGLIDPGPEPVPRRYVPPKPLEPHPPVPPDRRVVSLEHDGVGEFVRACRAIAGLSQRALASAAGMAQSTVARAEADGDGAVTLATLCRLTSACGVSLVGTVGARAVALETDRSQRHRDLAGRMLPAHLFNDPVHRDYGDWWGDCRYTHDRVRPRQSYRRRLHYRDRPPIVG